MKETLDMEGDEAPTVRMKRRPDASDIRALAGIVSIVLVFCGIMFRALFVTFVDNYEFAFAYDMWAGKIEKIDGSGWVVRWPIRYSVHTIDLRPQQVQISFNKRVLNAKLVRFDPKGIETFIEWHGRKAGDNNEELLEILKCYAFDQDEGRDCPFLSVGSVVVPGQGFEATKKATAEK